jgi:hypothetical protein
VLFSAIQSLIWGRSMGYLRCLSFVTVFFLVLLSSSDSPLLSASKHKSPRPKVQHHAQHKHVHPKGPGKHGHTKAPKNHKPAQHHVPKTGGAHKKGGGAHKPGHAGQKGGAGAHKPVHAGKKGPNSSKAGKEHRHKEAEQAKKLAHKEAEQAKKLAHKEAELAKKLGGEEKAAKDLQRKEAEIARNLARKEAEIAKKLREEQTRADRELRKSWADLSPGRVPDVNINPRGVAVRRVRQFTSFNRNGDLTFSPDQYYNFVTYPKTVSRSVAYETNYADLPAPPPNVTVKPLVIKAGNALPRSRDGSSLAAILTGLDVENNWLPSKNVDWRTGRVANDDPGPASNAGLFVAAVSSRLKVPMPVPTPKNMVPGSQYDWLLSEGQEQGWIQIGPVEAQFLANQGWVVIAAWKKTGAGNGPLAGQTAIVRPDAAPAAEIQKLGPRIIMAGVSNYDSIRLNDGFPASARDNVVFVAHRPS